MSNNRIDEAVLARKMPNWNILIFIIKEICSKTLI